MLTIAGGILLAIILFCLGKLLIAGAVILWSIFEAILDDIFPSRLAPKPLKKRGRDPINLEL